MTYNQSYIVKNVRGTIVELCGYFKVVSSDRALKRMRSGWSVEDAVCKPNGQKVGKKPLQGETARE